jgi:hypothetical protein
MGSHFIELRAQKKIEVEQILPSTRHLIAPSKTPLLGGF